MSSQNLPKNLFKVIEEPLKWPQALEILQNFDQAVHNHSDTMNMDYAENGWTYLFFTEDVGLMKDYKADRYNIFTFISYFIFYKNLKKNFCFSAF